MPEKKILSFPNVHQRETRLWTQLELFDCGRISANCAVFLNVDTLDQEAFLRIIASNGIISVIDLRPTPVFKKPQYNHRELIAYLNNKHIPIFEYAMARVHKAEYGLFSIARRINANRKNGITACLFDEEAVSAGWMDAARIHLRRSKLFTTELNPRSLTGIPRIT